MLPDEDDSGFVLALGGGGGRGLAHLGVLQALEEHDLVPSAIIGTSIGALLGSMYAINPNIMEIREQVYSFLESKVFNELDLPRLIEADTADHTWLGKLTAAARETVLYARSTTENALVNTKKIKEIFGTLLENKTFDELRIPLHVTTVRFPSGEIEIFSSGDLVGPVTASTAIPGIFEPVQIAGQSYVDGGLACELPAKEAKMVSKSGQIVVAVDVGARPRADVRPDTVIGMLDWAMRIKSLYLRQYKSEYADVLIQPIPGFRQWSDFTHPNHEIERGRQSALEHIPRIMSLLGR